MSKGFMGSLTILAVACLLYLDLAQSQCTSKYCEKNDEADLVSVVEQLRHELDTLNSKHERLQQNVTGLSPSSQYNGDVVGQLQDDVKALIERNTHLQEELTNIKSLQQRNENDIAILHEELSALRGSAQPNENVVGQLQKDVLALNETYVHLQQELMELKSTEQHNQKEVGQQRQEIFDLSDDLTNLERFVRLGKTERGAARSCKEILDRTASATNGVYWICTSSNCSIVRQLFCDMSSGGWTLIAQIGSINANIYDKWLTVNENTGILQTPIIESGTYGCIDAVDLAVNHASQIRLSSGESATGIGQYWVEWNLPSDRDVDTFWRYSLGFHGVYLAKTHAVEVRSSFASSRNCYHTKYGIHRVLGHFPSIQSFPSGDSPGDVCVNVNVFAVGTYGFGVSQVGPFNDAPSSNSDWPNANFADDRPFLSVWLH